MLIFFALGSVVRKSVYANLGLKFNQVPFSLFSKEFSQQFTRDCLKATKVKLNVKKILAVINATYAVAKRKPEKIRLAGIRTLTSAIPVQRSNQLS